MPGRNLPPWRLTTATAATTVLAMTTAEHDDILSGWGARLAAARTAANMTQAALAIELDVTLSTVQRWEAASHLRSSRRPNELDQRRIAEVLGTSVTDLFPRTAREAELEGIAADHDDLLERVGGGCS